MAKITINDLLDETSFLSDANLRFQQIEDELNNKVLYRDNPDGEPNGMSNDMDMQERDILNVDNLDTNTITINGTKIGGVFDPTLWGEIEGDMEDQLDLEARFQRVETGGVQTLKISDGSLTSLALMAETDESGNTSIEFTEAHNKAAGGIVTLNSRGLVDITLTEIGLVNNIGFFRGDDLCPKDAEIPNPPVPCGLPDERNPTERYGDIFVHGDTFLVSMEGGETTGKVNVIDPADATGPDTPTPVVVGDGLVFLDELVLGGVTLIRRGWHRWDGAVKQSTAINTDYNQGTNSEVVGSNLQVVLDGLEDNLVDSLAHQALITGNPHGVTVGDIGAEPADTNLQAHLTNNLNPHAVDKVQVGLPNVDNTSDIDKPVSTLTQNALGTKQDKGAYADVGGLNSGVTRYNYDSQTNTLTIFTQD